MASRFSQRVLRTPVTVTPTLLCSRLPVVTPTIRGTAAFFSAKSDAAAAAAAQQRLSSATAAWIARLKAQHGEQGWKAVYDESKARQERNLAEMRERHQQARAARQEFHRVGVEAAARRKAESAMAHEMEVQAAQQRRAEKARAEAERYGNGNGNGNGTGKRAANAKEAEWRGRTPPTPSGRQGPGRARG